GAPAVGQPSPAGGHPGRPGAARCRRGALLGAGPGPRRRPVGAGRGPAGRGGPVGALVGFAMISDNIPQPIDDGLVGPYYLWKLLIDHRCQRRGRHTRAGRRFGSQPRQTSPDAAVTAAASRAVSTWRNWRAKHDAGGPQRSAMVRTFSWR